MTTYKNVMIDLETMGNGPEAAIVAIGAVAFDIEAGELGPSYHNRVDLSSAVMNGGVMDASTVMWWMNQDDEARREIAREGAMHLHEALASFSVWLAMTAGPGVCVWGNGASFDNVILRRAYARNSLPEPWKWWNDRCYRTVKALHSDVEMARIGVHHNAASDAISQALHLVTMLNPAKREAAIAAQRGRDSVF